MWRYVLKRILMLIPVVIGVSFIIYFVMDLAPGNALDLMYPDASVEEMAGILASDGMLIKRPIVTDGSKVTVGFKEETFQENWL